ncbi:MAG: hypothetical protein HHJ09_11150 [Glaciimonas sp.]|nr:hypothetical protein [Glaciimonas sp.]
MKFVSNAGTDRIVELARPWLKPDHQLDVVSPSLSLLAFAKVIANMLHLTYTRLVMLFSLQRDAEVRVHDHLGLLGTKANRAARNKLQA